MKKILQEALKLSPGERAEIAAALLGSLRVKTRETVEERGGEMMAVMSEVLGEPLNLQTRQNRQLWGRAIVAYCLIKEGYSTTSIGRVMNRDHSTVMHMRDNVKRAFAYPHMYQEEIKCYISFMHRLYQN